MTCPTRAEIEAGRMKHPGRTVAQRRVLDAIGCGNNSPLMSARTREALLNAGLIVLVGRKIVGRDRFGAITLPEYEMPIPVHMQWCEAVAAEGDA